jgi:2-polyprenyl-6-methoxyphenol hydroxylase-like FAD-dependent oxidoreductase
MQEILVVGAGPTGLLLAISLAKLGVRVRIVDRNDGPATTSRALVVHARTLELYRQLGLAKAVVDRAVPMADAFMWTRGRRRAHVKFGEMGRGVSPFPVPLIYPQDEHERMLVAHLERLGVRVERRTELVSVVQSGESVAAVLSRDGKREEKEFAYVAGCDGTHSRVRESLGVAFPGGTYEHVFYVADVSARGPVVDRSLHIILDDADFLLVFPLEDAGRLRLIGVVRDEQARNPKLQWSDVSSRIFERMKIEVDAVHWFSTYHVHHKVANTFRVGSVFLLGDAAHVHSPVGGQGMNTGLGDAANLGWKLAAVLQGRASQRLLETYEPERIAFARRLVATTDRAFTFVTRSGPLARFVRVRVVPIVLPILFRVPGMSSLMFRTVSQTNIRYRDSDASEGAVGGIHGGDRLPWVQPAAEREMRDNFTPLESVDWQVHVYGAASATVREICTRHGLPLHELPWNVQARRAGLTRDATYLVRPDGYVALVMPPKQSRALAQYLERWRIRSRR